MSRYDRKRWWDGRPQTRQDRRKWYGILEDCMFVDHMFLKGGFVRHIYKNEYRIAEWMKGVVYHVDQKFTLEEAEAMCKLLNAAEENKT